MKPLYAAAMTSSSTSDSRNEAATTPAATVACATAPASRPWTPHAASKHTAAPRHSAGTAPTCRRLPPSEALVALIAGKRPLEPDMFHGGMTERHVEHDAEASRSGLAHKLVEIVHRSVDRIYCAVI